MYKAPFEELYIYEVMFNSHKTYYPHFIDEETEARRAESLTEGYLLTPRSPRPIPSTWYSQDLNSLQYGLRDHTKSQ
jgi:hypothetical protein